MRGQDPNIARSFYKRSAKKICEVNSTNLNNKCDGAGKPNRITDLLGERLIKQRKVVIYMNMCRKKTQRKFCSHNHTDKKKKMKRISFIPIKVKIEELYSSLSINMYD